MTELDARKLPFCSKSSEIQCGRRLIGLAFLAPDLQQEILEGRPPDPPLSTGSASDHSSSGRLHQGATATGESRACG